METFGLLVPLKVNSIVARYLFWSDWGHMPRIERASMDGDPTSRIELVNTGIVWPNGITLDYENERLFWIDANLHQIWVIDWNGGNRQQLQVLQNRQSAQPFAISYHQQMLYWTDWSTQ